jgi:hypothetical protein
MEPSYADLVSQAHAAVEAKFDLAALRNALSDIAEGNPDMSFHLTDGRTTLELSYRPLDRPRVWSVTSVGTGHCQAPSRLAPGWARTTTGLVPTAAELTELTRLIQSMEVTIPEFSMFGFVHEGAVLALLGPQAFRGGESWLFIRDGASIPGITGEPDPMKRLHTMWSYHGQGIIVVLDEELLCGRMNMVFCAGDGRSWIQLEHNPSWGSDVSRLLVPGAPYVECSLAPFAPVPTDKTHRVLS